jgi:FMN phosphatase YigB (HAD superfamily)
LASRKSEYRRSVRKLIELGSIRTLVAENVINYHLNLKRVPVALILFDLDDTLLGNEMNNFLPAYLQAFAQRMSKFAAPDIIIKTLMSATRQMVDNPSPAQTLEQKFDSAFYPALGVTRQDVQGIIDDFYVEDFPKLRGLTQLRPDAISAVKSLLGRGDQAAVATNPLFPRTAILQRLAWAGLPADEVPFSLIPAYDSFHFAKPNPAYFAEFLAQIGWPKTPVFMVGNDIESDIGAARQIGLPVFWMTNDGGSNWTGQEEIPAHGGFSELINWIDSYPAKPMAMNFSSPNALLAVLRSTPAALATLYRKHPENWEQRPTSDEWSSGEVLCHLRDVDFEVNVPRLEKFLSEENPFLAGQDTDPWAEIRQYQKQDGKQALEDFIKARLAVLKQLESIKLSDWDRRARHAIFGPIRLRELVNIIAGHDILHVQQVYRAL